MDFFGKWKSAALARGSCRCRRLRLCRRGRSEPLGASGHDLNCHGFEPRLKARQPGWEKELVRGVRGPYGIKHFKGSQSSYYLNLCAMSDEVPGDKASSTQGLRLAPQARVNSSCLIVTKEPLILVQTKETKAKLVQILKLNWENGGLTLVSAASARAFSDEGLAGQCTLED